MDNLDELVAFHKSECMRYRANTGLCLTLRCLQRAGYKRGEQLPAGMNGTCETHETVCALQRLAASDPPPSLHTEK